MDEWPCGRPLRVRWRAEIKYKNKDTGKLDQFWGETWRDGRKMVIDLSRRKCRAWDAMAVTLIHEYVHVLQWGPTSLEHDERCEDHSVAFYAQHGEITNRWNHDGGDELANDYEVT